MLFTLAQFNDAECHFAGWLDAGIITVKPRADFVLGEADLNNRKVGRFGKVDTEPISAWLGHFQLKPDVAALISPAKYLTAIAPLATAPIGHALETWLAVFT